MAEISNQMVSVSAYTGVVTPDIADHLLAAVVSVSAYTGVVTQALQHGLLGRYVSVSAYTGVVTSVMRNQRTKNRFQSPPIREL